MRTKPGEPIWQRNAGLTGLVPHIERELPTLQPEVLDLLSAKNPPMDRPSDDFSPIRLRQPFVWT